MSLAELKAGSQSLSPAERTELRAWLRLLDLKEDLTRQDRLHQLLGRAREGGVVNEDDLRAKMGARPAG
jgi:hypothetical protein